MKREQGWHYVLYGKTWEPCHNDGDVDQQWLCAGDERRHDDEDFDEIGPRVPTREEWQATAAELRRLRADIREMNDRFGHFADMYLAIPNEPASPAMLLSDLARRVRAAAEAAGGEG